MLKLNNFFRIRFICVILNLNTSYVEVKLRLLSHTGESVCHLNTSYVEVKRGVLFLVHVVVFDLNTSYVEVKLMQNQKVKWR